MNSFRLHAHVNTDVFFGRNIRHRYPKILFRHSSQISSFNPHWDQIRAPNSLLTIASNTTDVTHSPIFSPITSFRASISFPLT
ncbi:hypothetical protein L1987_54957 [Smallanthus sonchifolius]|uniref:Uncharacterized protein n=1 Tax=Smallanthus sonchifolius TaxID=185202 RepID=A0ACB9E8K1_9ASTR|nr:hypothetical protein L1987_54957 [Smallanthus sonchifolius]